MRKCYISVLSLLLLFTKAQAQDGMLELQGTGIVSGPAIQKTIGGGGMGMGLYSPAVNILKPQTPHSEAPLAIRFGGDMMFDFIGYKTFRHVPLQSPESGNAEVDVSNMFYNLNTGLRLTTSAFSGRLIPYLDLNAGYRLVNSDMNIYPDDKEKDKTFDKLESVKGFCMSIGAGAIVALTKDNDICLNVGIGLNHSGASGKFVDMSRVQRIGNSIDYYTRPSIDDYMVFRAGITAKLDYHNQSQGCHGGGYHSSYHGSSHCGGGGHSSVSVHAH